MDNEELTLFRDMARRAFEQEIVPHYASWEEQHMVPRELWNTLGQAGLLCPDMPEEYGGAGTTPHVCLALIEELSRMGMGGLRLRHPQQHRGPLYQPFRYRGAETAVAAENDQR